MFDPTPFTGGQGGSTSLETNFLSIQSGGSKFTQMIGGEAANFIGVPPGFQPGSPVPVGSQG